ncbi:hypothetical protein ACK8P5_23245 [Paenibacillus sp. EC2-1]|uniref:hypothetical protein n=1 Tax=Paenibacillus sp. EC2-1 TaxID=3388665 RepID=UPI003BEF021D
MPDKKDSARISEERGSALVLVMFIALLFTILGVTVLSAAVGGAQRTETRKNDVQSLHLAEKTLEETVAYITAELESKVKLSNNSNKDDLDYLINNYLSNLKNNNVILPTSTELTDAEGQIMDIDYERIEEYGQPVSYKLTLLAQADVNGVQRELIQEVVFDTFPDFLKYTLGSEANLTINGSPEVTGNIYAGVKLYVSDEAQYDFHSNSLTMKSTPFELKPSEGLKDSGEAHIQSLKDVMYTQNDKSGSMSAADMLEEGIIWPGILPMDKLKIKNHRKFVQMNVEESFLDKVMEAIGNRAGVDRGYVRSKISEVGLAEFLGDYLLKYDVSIPGTLPVRPLVPEDSLEPEDIMLWTDYRNAIERFTRPADSQVIKGDLVFDGVELAGIQYKDGVSKSGKWYVVDGNMKIDNYSDHAMFIHANLLVSGNLEIRGNVQLDSTVFVLGSTLVEDASIGGSGAVVISKGPILVNRFDAFKETTQTLNAFFYTDATAELYGVGSIFSLNGGFFAKGDLTVNAVRGEAKDGGDVIQVNNTGLIRFRANYNNQVYIEQGAGLPRVNNISVRVGNVRLK